MKKARVIYNAEEEKYEVQINTGDGWGLDVAYTFVARYGDQNPEHEKSYLHYSIITKLAELQHLGYEINLKTL